MWRTVFLFQAVSFSFLASCAHGWNSECPRECQCFESQLSKLSVRNHGKEIYELLSNLERESSIQDNTLPTMEYSSIIKPSPLSTPAPRVNMKTTTKKVNQETNEIPMDFNDLNNNHIMNFKTADMFQDNSLRGNNDIRVWLTDKKPELKEITNKLTFLHDVVNRKYAKKHHILNKRSVMSSEEGKPGTTTSAPEPPVKTTMCVLQRGSNVDRILKGIPMQTQVLNILQGIDSTAVHFSSIHFGHLSQLKVLGIQGYHNNELSITIATDSLRKLNALQHLSLQWVNMSDASLTPDLSNLRSLTSLTLTYNDLKSLPATFLYGLHSLEELVIEHNPLTSLPEDVFLPCARTLERLFLNNNALESSDDGLLVAGVELPALEVLDLTDNNISYVSEITFPSLPKLRVLELKQNPIRVVFINAFSLLNTTQRLTLGHSDQPVHIMKYSFNGLYSLKSLSIPNIENDVLEKDMFSGLVKLRELTLHGHVASISFDAFLGLRTLEKLTLSNCKLQRLSMDSFLGLKSLHLLDLSSNQISKLPPGIFDPLKSLRELYLYDNQLRTLPDRMFQHIPLKSLRLDGNPWHCSCELMWWDAALVGRVKKTVYRSCQVIGDPSSCQTQNRYLRDPQLVPRCVTPEEYNGRTVFDVVRREMRCYKKV